MTPVKALIFIDASVFIAAAGSPAGGSALLLDICKGSQYAAICSQRVLLEAQTNIRDKLPAEALVRFYVLLAAASPSLIPAVTPDEEMPYYELVTAKDAHVVASAVKGGAHFLVTLDRKHLANETVREAGLPVQVMTPGDFLQSVCRRASAG